MASVQGKPLDAVVSQHNTQDAASVVASDKKDASRFSLASIKDSPLAKIGSTILIAAIALYFWRTLQQNWSKVNHLDLSLSVRNVTAFALYIAAIVTSGILWGVVFRRITRRQTSKTEAVRSHCGSWLMKYVPGQVGAVVYKLRWGQTQGASKKATAVAFGYEMLFRTLASTVLVIPIILLGAQHNFTTPLLIGYSCGFVLLLAITGNKVRRFIALFLSKVTKQKVDPASLLGVKDIALHSVYFMSARILNSAGFVLLATSMTQISPSRFVYLGASYILAGIVGIYAIFVPSGLGVREGVIVALTRTFLPLEVAIALALVARLYATLSDVVVAAIYLYLTKNHTQKENK